jgi:hypothetical protein
MASSARGGQLRLPVAAAVVAAVAVAAARWGARAGVTGTDPSSDGGRGVVPVQRHDLLVGVLADVPDLQLAEQEARDAHVLAVLDQLVSR